MRTFLNRRSENMFSALLMSICLMLGASDVAAQLIPEQLYYGVGRRVVVHVEVPEDAIAEPSIKLYRMSDFELLETVPAARGRTDLASLFPILWRDKPHDVMLAQLFLNDQAWGAPLVLQPMVTPNPAVLVNPSTLALSESRDGEVMFEDERQESLRAQGRTQQDEEESRRVFSGLRVYVEQEVVLKTTAGEIVFRLRPDVAPNTAYNFMHLVSGGFYANVIFHRVREELDDGRRFVIQMGDPSGTGFGGPGYNIDLEQSTLPHDFGVLSMARANDPNTNGSQVFVCLSREGTSYLDGRYTSFAQAVSGTDAILKIAATPVDSNDRPLDPPMIERAFLRDAPSIQDRMPPVTQDDSGTFEPGTPDR